MTRLLLAGSALIALGLGGALAADLPTKAPALVPVAPSWTGFYIGGSLGMRLSDADWRTTAVDPAHPAPIPTAPRNDGKFGTANLRIGAFTGYNMQFDR